MSQSIYIPRGIDTPALDKNIPWEFEPVNFKVRFVRTAFFSVLQ